MDENIRTDRVNRGRKSAGGFNRQQRRALKGKLFKQQKPKKLTRGLLHKNEPSINYEALLERFPMREQDARVLGKYMIGQATAEQANEAFLESLRDPSWMMRWFANHSAKLSPFIKWVRAPAQKMLVAMEGLASAAREMREKQAELGTGYDRAILSPEKWAQLKDEMIQNVAQRTLEHYFPGSPALVLENEVDERCPGLSTLVRSMQSVVWDSTSAIPRQLKASDFVDGIHAMYAPYVDIFRADTYMAAHIERHTTRYDTIVVPKLMQLVPKLKERLGSL